MVTADEDSLAVDADGVTPFLECAGSHKAKGQVTSLFSEEAMTHILECRAEIAKTSDMDWSSTDTSVSPWTFLTSDHWFNNPAHLSELLEISTQLLLVDHIYTIV